MKSTQTLILAISGGPDSVYLLHQFLKNKLGTPSGLSTASSTTSSSTESTDTSPQSVIKPTPSAPDRSLKNPELVLAHFNHQLRGAESDGDETFVRELAKQHQLVLEVGREDVKKWAQKHKKSLEEAGRILRYRWLEKIRKKHDARWIVTAHHLNDNLETVLMNRERGCGLRGEIAMNEYYGRIWRPLLDTPKSAILNDLKTHQIPYRIDSSNQDTRFKRNHIRQEIIPKMMTKNPRLLEDFQKERAIALQQYTTLKQEAARWLEVHEQKMNASREPNSTKMNEKVTLGRLFDEQKMNGTEKTTHKMSVQFPLAPYQKLPLTKRQFLLQHLYETLYGSTYQLKRKWIEAVDELFMNSRTGTQHHFGKQWTAEVNYGNAVFRDAEGGASTGIDSLSVTSPQNALTIKRPKGNTPFSVPLNLNKIPNGTIRVRSWKPGDRFQPSGMTGTKKLQDYFTDSKIPRRERHQIPIFTTDDDTIIAVGNRLDERFMRRDPQTQNAPQTNQ